MGTPAGMVEGIGGRVSLGTAAGIGGKEPTLGTTAAGIGGSVTFGTAAGTAGIAIGGSAAVFGTVGTAGILGSAGIGGTAAGTDSGGGGATSAGGQSGASATAGGGASGGGATNTGGASGGGGASGSAGASSSCPSSLCSIPYVQDNCGPTCGPITSAACATCGVPDECNVIQCSGLNTAAEGGPAVGVVRSTLCNEALSCFRSTGCSLTPNTTSGVVAACYCGTAATDNCQTDTANGPCKVAMERAFESSGFAAILAGMTNANYGGARAYARVDCDGISCAGVCFGPQ